VFCVDEKSAIQALERLERVLPLSRGRLKRHGFEYYRHGTLSLCAALIHPHRCDHGQNHRPPHQSEFVAFLTDLVAHEPRGKELHIIADNRSAHKTKHVEQFLAAHPNVRLALHAELLILAQPGQKLVCQKLKRDVIRARSVHFSKGSQT
jgi:hypothetical protein